MFYFNRSFLITCQIMSNLNLDIIALEYKLFILKILTKNTQLKKTTARKKGSFFLNNFGATYRMSTICGTLLYS